MSKKRHAHDSDLIQLYLSYVNEWNCAESQLSVGLLNSLDRQLLGKHKHKRKSVA
jgi:hypothetical protein